MTHKCIIIKGWQFFFFISAFRCPRYFIFFRLLTRMDYHMQPTCVLIFYNMIWAINNTCCLCSSRFNLWMRQFYSTVIPQNWLLVFLRRAHYYWLTIKYNLHNLSNNRLSANLYVVVCNPSNSSWPAVIVVLNGI